MNITDSRSFIRIKGFIATGPEFVQVVPEVGLHFAGYTVNSKVI